MLRVVVFTLAVISMGLAAPPGYGSDIDRTAVDFDHPGLGHGARGVHTGREAGLT